ncbi:MAG: helix-turn-helix domain-containing protein [Kiritimatiellae bacterium]|nr:helix-turn-helix domain-containing protein [Kiritimatiellia bacterium]
MDLKPSIGKQFREARERKGMSLAEAAEITRIKPTQIQAMEQGDFSSMAAPLYIKGFIRIYAKALGLDSRELIEHAMSAPDGPPASAPALAPENTSRMLHTRHAPSPALAPPVDRFAPPGEEGSAVVSAPPPPPPSPEPAAPGPRTRSTVHVPLKPPPPPEPSKTTSVLARRLSETQRIINQQRPPAAAQPAPPTGEFDFPNLTSSAGPRPSRKKDAERRVDEPDLFAYRPSPPRSIPAPVAMEPFSPMPPSAAEPVLPAPSRSVHGRTPARLGETTGKYWGRLRTAWLPVYGPPIVMAALLLVAATALTSTLRACTADRATRAPDPGPGAPSGYGVEPPDPYILIEPGVAAPRTP